MKTFDDLVFERHKVFGHAKRAEMFFDNGYGVSVVSGMGFGYELMVLEKKENDSFDFVFDDPFFYLDELEVSEKMIKYQNVEKGSLKGDDDECC